MIAQEFFPQKFCASEACYFIGNERSSRIWMTNMIKLLISQKWLRICTKRGFYTGH
jgi:hypothetical protein